MPSTMIIDGPVVEGRRSRLQARIWSISKAEIRECWHVYLGEEACCEGCRTGTADCDINPQKRTITRDEAVDYLAQAWVIP